MKKILLLFFVSALLPMAIRAQGTPTDDTFTLSDLTTNPSGTFFNVNLVGSRIYSAYNLDIFLPFGVSVALDANSKPRVVMMTSSSAVYPATVTQVWDDELNGGEGGWKDVTTYSHSLGCSQPNSNQLRISCNSNTNEEFTKNSGLLFRVFVTLDDAVLSASYSSKPIVKLSGLNLTTSAEDKYVPADFACRPFTTGIPKERTIAVNVSAANQVGTLILPFDTELPSGLKAYSCSSVSGDKLVLSEANSIEACTPYIVYASSGYSGNLNGTVTLSDNNNVTDVFTDGLLTGVLTATTTNTGYVLQNQGAGPKFYDTDGGTFSIPAGRCYLTTPASPVKAFYFDFEGTTGIESIQNSKFKIQNEVFDLQGRKVSSPQRGIYIKGMRKVIVK